MLPSSDLEDVAATIYTSGTTDRPKGVMLTHRNIVSDVAACYRAVRFEEERFLSVLPMHHSLESTGGFLLPLYSGSHITFARNLKSKNILADLKACRASVMLGVPLLFQKMLEGIHRGVRKRLVLTRVAFRALMRVVRVAERGGKADLGRSLFRGLREKAGLGSLRLLVVGGAPLLPHIPREFRHLGIKMLQGYGLTEASPVLTLNPEEAPMDESVGLPLPEVEVTVLDPDENGQGELAFRGPMVMKGYYRNPEATADVLDNEGWLKTGDLGHQDRQGYLYVSGRKKNLIVTAAGKNVSPEVEAELNLSPFVLKSMVHGQAAPNKGEEVHAVIVPDYEAIGAHVSGKRLSDDEIRRLIQKEVRSCMKALAPYKHVKAFRIQDEEFPKTSTRKIKRHLFSASADNAHDG